MTRADYALALTLFGTICYLAPFALMCLVVFHLLDMRQPEGVTTKRYQTAFRFNCSAIFVAFSGAGTALLL